MGPKNTQIQETVWWILVEGKPVGPLTLNQLKDHPQFSPDALVRKTGSGRWMAARLLAELRPLFRDPKRKSSDQTPAPSWGRDELVLEMHEDPPQFLLWLIIVLLVLLYTWLKLYG